MHSHVIYSQTLARLDKEIRAHVCPSSGKANLKAFCTEYGINRPNLATLLNGRSEMSVALFVRICEALGRIAPGRIDHSAKHLNQVGLQAYLAIDYTALTQLLLTLHIEPEQPTDNQQAEQPADGQEVNSEQVD